MFVYLSKKISIPNNVLLKCISWSRKEGYVACGGDDGLLKVLKLETTGKDGIKGLAAPSNLSVNQNLEGHSGAIQVVAWNEVHQKLTTSDQFGLIIVWMLYKENQGNAENQGSWYEEMINNRNKSIVRDMAWNNDGQRICIVYEDGAIIVGSVDGNRLWGKEIKGSLVAIEWSPNGQVILFGLSTGEVHAYDNEGNFLSKVPVMCLQSIGDAQLIAIRWHYSESGTVEGSPALALLYQHGAIQVMRNENDNDPIILHETNLRIVDAAWNPAGNILAVAGKSMDLPDGEQNVVYFISPVGEHLRCLKVPGKDLTGCSWEGTGLRIALSIDSHIFFANIRPDYKWGYCAQTVIYSFQKTDRTETCVIFWDTKLDELHMKYVRELMSVTCSGDYCVVASRADEQEGQYLLQLCNGIGTPVDFKFIEIEPLFVAVNHSHVIVANKEAFYLWQFSVPRKSHDVNVPKRASVPERVYHIDNISLAESQTDIKKGYAELASCQKTMDPICSICASDKLLLIARESNMVHRYALPNVSLMQKHSMHTRALRMAINCSNNRVAIISMSGVLTFFDLQGSGSEVAGFERKDVWDMKWDEDNELLLAVMEKTRLYVFRGLEAEEPVVTSGYICQFKDLTVRTVLLDEVVHNPEHPTKDLVVDVEIKALRDAKNMMEKGSLPEVAKFIDQNPHPKLWALLAEVALNRMDIPMAEQAFVHLKDYAGIQFVKKVNNIQSENLRKAEIAAYFGRFDEAEKIYMDSDRRDLALSLRRKLGDWFRVLTLLQSGSGAGDDQQLEEAWNAVGDYYADRHKWQNAINHFEPGKNYERLTECYYMTEDYEKLEKLMKSLSDNHKLLPNIADMFAGAGLCEQAVEAFTKCDAIKKALDVCIQLNQWDAAAQLARSHDIQDVDRLLSKYAEQLTSDPEKQLTAVQLYRKSSQFLEAAKLIYHIAEDHKRKGWRIADLKKTYVLGALLIEQHRQQAKQGPGEKGNSKRETQAALSGLLTEETIEGLDTRLIDNAWRGSEAYHFYMLAQRQLYESQVDLAMKTALHLTDYDDILDPVDIYSLLALASCANRQFSVCSRAFIKLESLENISEDQREAYEKLALDIFTKNNPKDSKSNKAECTGCETLIPDYCQICPSCDTKFPTCIVTGKPLMDYQFWLCPVCKHRAYEQEIATHKFCPLCHTAIY